MSDASTGPSRTGAAPPAVEAQSAGATPAVDWVVGFDGSISAKHAVAWAVVNGAGRADELRIVQAVDAPSPAGCSQVEALRLAEVVGSVEAATRREIEHFAAELSAPSPPHVSTNVERGSGSTVLLKAAQSGDLLVLGARGSGGFERLGIGSTSTQCATHAVVPTVIVPSPSGGAEPVRARTILVPVDGSDNSISAFYWACAFAEPGTVITVVSVWEFAPSLFSGESFYFPEAIADARGRFDDMLGDLVHGCERDDIVVGGQFVQGATREEIAARAAGSDLLVMGARGRGAVGAVLLGSVSTWLLHHVQIPMVVVPSS